MKEHKQCYAILRTKEMSKPLIFQHLDDFAIARQSLAGNGVKFICLKRWAGEEHFQVLEQY